MPAVLPVIGVAAAVAGVGISVYGMVQQQKAAKQQAEFQAQAIDAQKKSEALRKKAMDLDASRRRRELVRQQVSARAAAETVATNQGAQFGSVLPGAYAGIEGRTGVNAQGINQNQEIGAGIFANNATASDAYRNAALAGGNAATGAGLASLGGMLINNYETIGKVGSFFAPATA